MEDHNSFKIKKLTEKIKSHEKIGENLNEYLETIGCDYSSISPPNLSKISEDRANPEIIKLRVQHHEKKRLHYLLKLSKLIQSKKNPKNDETSEISTHSFRLGSEIINEKLEKLKKRQKRRTEASEKVLATDLNQKKQLIKKIKEKETKTAEHQTKHLALVKEKIEKFQKEEKNKFNTVKLNISELSTRSNNTSKRLEPRETKSVPPLKLSKNPKKNQNYDDDSLITYELKKYDEKMVKAKERYDKLQLEKIKTVEKRSKTIKELKTQLNLKRKEQDKQLLINLIEINDNITRSKLKKSEYIQQKILKANKFSSARINKNNEDEYKTLEQEVLQKNKKIQEKIEDLKNKYDLNMSLKKEKNKLALEDIYKNRVLQEKHHFIAKNKILSKHIEKSKAFELRKVLLDKFEQEIREKEYQFSQNQAKSKTLHKIQDFDPYSFLITA
jgi:hypothetical protein